MLIHLGIHGVRRQKSGRAPEGYASGAFGPADGSRIKQGPGGMTSVAFPPEPCLIFIAMPPLAVLVYTLHRE